MTVVPLLQTCKHTAPTGQTIHGVFERSRTKPTTFIDVRVRISGGPEKIEIDKSLIHWWAGRTQTCNQTVMSAVTS